MRFQRRFVLTRWLSLFVLVFWLIGSRSEAEQLNVAKLRDEGVAAYQAGNYAAAKAAFDRAFAVAPLHSLGVWTARSRDKLGELLEADERYGKVLDTPLPAGAEATEGEARDHAAREREELRRRIPHVRIRLEGVNPAEIEVRMDGALVSDEFLIVKKNGPFRHGKALQVNPGTHQILAVSADQRKDASVSVKEGETRDVTLQFAQASTMRQRKCRDLCRKDCGDNNDCYVECKQRCFSKG
jgi:tetratricopeptide (TPR) repeat protein